MPITNVTRNKNPKGETVRDVALDLSVMVQDPAWTAKVPRLKKKIQLAVETTLLSQNKLKLKYPLYELNIVLTGDADIQKLNSTHRKKNYATNVLSFPMETKPAGDGLPVLLGDIVLTHGVITAEAKTEGKPFQNHLIHLVIHGALHLCGYDHETTAQARTMERLERSVLADLDIPDPYMNR